MMEDAARAARAAGLRLCGPNCLGLINAYDNVMATFNTHWMHNYNHVSRTTMYGFMNKHFKLGFSEPVLELELELLSGPASALQRLAERLRRQVALTPSSVTKAERGFRLRSGT